jgi:hypothetical protein
MVTGPADITHAMTNPHSTIHNPDTTDHLNRDHLLNTPEIQNIDQPYGIRTKTPKIIPIIAPIRGFCHFCIQKILVFIGKTFWFKSPNPLLTRGMITLQTAYSDVYFLMLYHDFQCGYPCGPSIAQL